MIVQGSHRSLKTGKFLKTFFQSGKSEKYRGFSAKIKGKNFKSGEIFNSK